MKKSLQKFIIAFIGLLIVVEPILQISQIPSAKAADPQPVEANLDVVYDGNSKTDQPENIGDTKNDVTLASSEVPTSAVAIFDKLKEQNPDADRESGIGLDEALANQVQPRIILNGEDQQALKILSLMTGDWMMPDFVREPEEIWKEFPRVKTLMQNKDDTSKAKFAEITAKLGHEVGGLPDLITLKATDYSHYLDLAYYAKTTWADNLGKVDSVIRKTTDDAFYAVPPTIPEAKYISTLSDITGETVASINQIFEERAIASSADAALVKYTGLMDTFAENIKAVKMDIRVVKLLTYLVTPKTQGGAGHYRIKVKTILVGYTAPKKIYTRESETIYLKGSSEVIDGDTRTAADFGQNRPSTSLTSSSGATSFNNIDSNADVLVYDQDGESYNAFVSEASAAESTPAKMEESKKNISAHSDGQAVDISEVDDIRCTLIKKRRIGGYSRSKFMIRPTKLAWQTTNGFAENGGGDLYKTDMANVLKSFAASSITDLVAEFGGDLTNYDGDLSSAGFGDVAMLIGKSIFTQIINSPGSDLQGYNFGDTLTQLGGMFMADYLGLPREMFTQGSFPGSYDELAERIGTAAIEKRLDLPIGTFAGNNLKEMLQKVGQRKLEFEMNLKAGALDSYFHDYISVASILTKEDRGYLVGKAIIEQELNLPKGSYSGVKSPDPTTYADLRQSLGTIKSDLVFRDPVYADNLLKIEIGTTQKLKDLIISPIEYATLVGAKREDDTIYGFQFMTAADSAYELNEGIFVKILEGDLVALADVGIKHMARVFTTGDDERIAFTQWVNANLTKTMGAPDAEGVTACDWGGDTVKVTIPSGREVTLTEDKAIAVGMHRGDLFSMFACPDSNPRTVFQTVGSKILRDSMVQYYLTPEEKVKFNLLETNHVFTSTDAEKAFYITRAYRIVELLEQLKGNYDHAYRDPEFLRMKRIVDEGRTSIQAILDTSMPVTSVDQAKKAGRQIAVAVNKLKSDANALRAGSNRYINMLNGTIIDISELVKTVSEIIEGKEIPSSETLTLADIPVFAYSATPDTTASAPVLNSDAAPRTTNDSLVGLIANKQTFMALLARKMSPKDFFLIMASDRVEVALDLPQNSLIYFVQNYEKKGLGTADSFYAAVGQAKIEETFNMPGKYFQGPLISDPALTAYDFRNDFYALYEYGRYDVIDKLPPPIDLTMKGGPLKAYAFDATTPTIISGGYTGGLKNTVRDSIDKMAPDWGDIYGTDGVELPGLTDEQKEIVRKEHYVAELLWVKTTNAPLFDYLVNKAQTNYTAQMQEAFKRWGLAGDALEQNISNVVYNVDKNKLNDSIRSAEQDLLFRMGMPGSTIEGLTSGSSVAWLGASARANQIDKLFSLPAGSTKSLFTGERSSSPTGISKISQKDKQILVAKMGISPVAIDLLLQYLSGEIPISQLEALALDVTNIGDNQYLGADTDTCTTLDASFALDVADGSLTDGAMIAQNLIPDSWFYYDKTMDTRGMSFGSRQMAEKYRDENPGNQTTYIDEIAYGLAKAAGTTKESVLPRLVSYLKNETTTLFTGDLDPFKNISIGPETYRLLFNPPPTTVEVPLVTYKRAVGKQVVNKTINSKIFKALGLNISPDLFTGNEFFDIMRGDYSSLWNIAGSMVDQKLGIPTGSTLNILTAKSSTLRKCSVAALGGSILGKFIGLDYVSLQGNIYENIGRSRLEKMLGLPKDSFAGKNVEGLMDNVGPVNFYIAFDFPLGGVDLNTPIEKFYGTAEKNRVVDFSNQYKLQRIKDFVDVNTGLSRNPERNNAYTTLKNQLKAQRRDNASKALLATASYSAGAWRGDEIGWGASNTKEKEDISAYLNRVDSIDRTFGIDVGTTAAFVSGADITITTTKTITCGLDENGTAIMDPDDGHEYQKHWEGYIDGPPDYVVVNGVRHVIPTSDCSSDVVYQVGQPAGTMQITTEQIFAALTPAEYVKKVSGKTLLGAAAYQALDLFDFDMSEAQKQSVVATFTHIGNWVKEGSYDKIYNNFSTIFSLHLDARAGLDEGTIGRILEYPDQAGRILIPQAARKIDQQLGINPAEKWSFSGVYQRYFNNTPSFGPIPNANPKIENDCRNNADLLALEANIKDNEAYVRDWINARGGYGAPGGSGRPVATLMSDMTSPPAAYDITDDPEYPGIRAMILSIDDMKTVYTQNLNQCKAGNRFGGTASDGTVKVGTNMIDQTIANYCRTPSEENKEMCADIADKGSGGIGGIGRTLYGSDVKWKFAWMIVTDYASDKIHDEIFRVTKGTVSMPAVDIKHFFANGDMRYFTTALATYGANYFQNKLLKDDPSTPEDESTERIPVGMQISYDMLKFWIVGNPMAEDYSATAAAANYLNPDAADPDFESVEAPAAYRDVFETDYRGGMLGTLTSSEFIINSANSDRSVTGITPLELTSFNMAQTDLRYNAGSSLDAATINATRSNIARLNIDADNCQRTNQAFAEKGVDSLTVAELEAVGQCNTVIDQREGVHNAMRQATSDTRNRFGKQAQYRMMDATLWSKDHNIFPGFSYMLLEGSGKQKNVAISMYLKNGMITGEFFGKKIGFLQTITEETGMSLWEWNKVYSFMNDLIDSTRTGGMSADLVLYNANTSGALDAVGTFVDHYSENWFGFKIDKDYAKALMVGATTGHWGLSLGSSSDTYTWKDPSNPTKTFTVDTLGGVFKAKVTGRSLGKAFAWADRQLGWGDGTALKAYETGKQIFQAANTLRKLQTFEKLQKAAEAAGAAEDAKKAFDAYKLANTGLTESVANNPNGIQGAKDAQAAAIWQIVCEIVGNYATKWIWKNNGAKLDAWSEKMGLVPGSLQSLVEAWITSELEAAIAILTFNPALAVIAAVTWIKGLVTFIGVNLFGFYDTDLKCTADGYFPELESPSIANDSNSGLGIWDGMNENEATAKTIATAQYKAKRLVQDAIEMHKQVAYKDIYPSQIMTGRNEDVLSLNDKITENICSKIGLIAVDGVCGGNTRAGVWQNDQMATYTHIGF